MIWLNVTFYTAGCQYSKKEFEEGSPCTSYNFGTSITTEVDLASGESYTGGRSSGLIDFWGPPLPKDGDSGYLGTVFADDRPVNSSAVVGDVSSTANNSRLIVAWAPPNGINMSGSAFYGPYTFYQLIPATFGTGENYQYAWMNVSSSYSLGNQSASIFPLGPQGFYDYYNGLAYSFSLPDYPINRTVCAIYQESAVTDCRYTSYSTTLGDYFRSGQGILNLEATNIQLDPTQSNRLALFDTILVGVAAVVTVSLSVVYWLRKR